MAARPRNFEEAFGTPERDDQGEGSDEEGNEGNINNNVLTLQSIQDNIISPSTLKSYIGDLIQLFVWVQRNENHWLTRYGNDKLAELFVQQENERDVQHRVRRSNGMANLLRMSYTEPIVHLDQIVPATYMQFLLSLTRNNSYLSKSSYGCKRAALFHLFRLHNRTGFHEAFRLELGNLFKGLYRQIAASLRNAIIRRNNNGVVAPDDNNHNREAKELMSVELYKLLCELLLKKGTTDGVFGHCYLEPGMSM